MKYIQEPLALNRADQTSYRLLWAPGKNTINLSQKRLGSNLSKSLLFLRDSFLFCVAEDRKCRHWTLGTDSFHKNAFGSYLRV